MRLQRGGQPGAPGATGPTGAPGSGGLTLLGATLAGIAWAIPASATDLLGLTGFRVPAKLSDGPNQWRLVAYIGSSTAAGTTLRCLYSTTAGGALVTMGNGGDIAASASGSIVGTWTDIPAGALGEVFLAVQGQGGDGVATAVFHHIGIQFK